MIKPSDLNLDLKKLLLANFMAACAVCVLNSIAIIGLILIFSNTNDSYQRVIIALAFWGAICFIMMCLSVFTDLVVKGWYNYCQNYLCLKTNDYGIPSSFGLNHRLNEKLKTYCRHSYYYAHPLIMEHHIYFLSREDMMAAKLLLGGEVKEGQ